MLIYIINLIVFYVSWKFVILEEIWCHKWIYHGILYKILEKFGFLVFFPGFVKEYLEATYTHHMVVHHNIIRYVNIEEENNNHRQDESNKMLDHLTQFRNMEEFFKNNPKKFIYKPLQSDALTKHSWTIIEAKNGMGCFFAGMFLHGLSYIFSPIFPLYIVIVIILSEYYQLRYYQLYYLLMHLMMILWSSACSCYIHKNFHYKDEWGTLPKWKKVLFLYSKTQYEIIKHQHLIHHKFPAWNFSVSPYSNNIESLLGTAKNYAFT